MIRIQVKWDQDLRHVREWVEELTYAADAALEDTLSQIARSMQQRAKNKIRSGPKSGILYKRYNPVRVVQASAPGEAPADDTGTLANGIILRKTETTDVYVEATALYSKLLEFGGVAGKGAYIAPRPYFYPAFFEAVDRTELNLANAFRSKL